MDIRLTHRAIRFVADHMGNFLYGERVLLIAVFFVGLDKGLGTFSAPDTLDN